MRTSIITTPRPVPGKLLPTAGALLVLGVALAVFLVAGWDISAWALAAVLCAFFWPLLPFNPYNIHDASAAGDAFAAFEVPLDAARPAAVFHVTA